MTRPQSILIRPALLASLLCLAAGCHFAQDGYFSRVTRLIEVSGAMGGGPPDTQPATQPAQPTTKPCFLDRD